MKNWTGTVSRIVRASACTLAFFALSASAATVKDIAIKTHYPWNGLVDVSYGVEGITNGSVYRVTAKVIAGATTFEGVYTTNVNANTTYAFRWDAAAACFTGRVEDAKVVLTVAEPDFAAIDLSAGPTATEYPVTYLSEITDTNIDDYKTDKLLLKRVGANYVGVFEVTQRQYERVTGEKNPSHFSYLTDSDEIPDAAAIEAKRPVERVSYEKITATDGFFDRLCARTDLKLALPTAAEWEAAARGQMPKDKDYNLGADNYRNLTGTTADNAWLPTMGRYIDLWKDGKKTANGNANPNRNCDASKGTAIVGSYNANDNGLYDMHGNVAEWTLEDAKGGNKVLRGGAWQDTAEACAIGAKWAYPPADVHKVYTAGFRVFGAEPDEAFEKEVAVTSKVFAVDVAFDSANENRRYLTAEDRGQDKTPRYAFFYWTNNVENLARTQQGGSRGWARFDEGVKAWRPETYGTNVTTFTDAAGADWKATFIVKDNPWFDGITTNGVEELVYDADWHDRSVEPVNPAVSYKVEYGESEGAITLDAPPKYINVGTYTNWYRITPTGYGPFFKPLVGSFQLKITPRSVEGADINRKHKLTYTGSCQTQALSSVILAFNRLDGLLTNVTLVAGRDYSVSNNWATEAGKYKLAIYGIGNFTGSQNKKWEIEKFDLTGQSVVAVFTNVLYYTGAPQTLEDAGVTNVTVTVSGGLVIPAGSYEFAGTPATEVGTHTDTITGSGSFTGSASVEWTIEKRPVTATNLTAIAWEEDRLLWTGEELKPTLASLTIDGIVFTNEQIEGVVVTNAATEAGRHTSGVIFDASDNFTGASTLTQEWFIVPTAPTITPNNGGKFIKIADHITVELDNTPHTNEWAIWYTTNDVDWINYPYKSGKFDIAGRTTVRAYSVSADGVVTGETSTCEYYFGPQYAEPPTHLEDLSGHPLHEKDDPTKPATNFYQTANIVIDDVGFAGATILYTLDYGSGETEPAERPADHKVKVSDTVTVRTWVQLTESEAGPVVTNTYYRKWETFAQPKIQLLNPYGALTNDFRYTADRVSITNDVTEIAGDIVAWTNANVKVLYAIVTNSTDTTTVPAPEAFKPFDWKNPTNITFKADSNVVWAIASCFDYISSTNATAFVRKLDAPITKPKIKLDNTGHRRVVNVAVDASACVGASALYVEWAITNRVEDAKDPVGSEYDVTQASARYTGPFDVMLQPGQMLIVKARCYAEDDTSALVSGVAETNFTSRGEIAVDALALEWTIGDALDAPDCEFRLYSNPQKTVNTNCLEDATTWNCGGSSMVFTNLTHNETVTIATTVYGPGTVVFDWKTMCEAKQLAWRDHFEFSVDGEVLLQLDGDSGWQTVTNYVKGIVGEKHTLAWTYVKDPSEKKAPDCAWLDNVRWIASDKGIVISEELDGWAKDVFGEYYYNLLLCPGGAYNYSEWTTALGLTAANGVNTYYESYLLGLDVDDMESIFIAETPIFEYTFDPGVGGNVLTKVTINWQPCTKAGRTYTLVGRKELTDDAWKPLHEEAATADDPTGGSISASTSYVEGYKFFQLSVRMTK